MPNALLPNHDQDVTNGPELNGSDFEMAPARDRGHYGSERMLRGVPRESLVVNPELVVTGEISARDIELAAEQIAMVREASDMVFNARGDSVNAASLRAAARFN